MGIWDKLISLKRKIMGELSIDELVLSPRGECMLQYCESIIKGEENYIESYEEELLQFIRINDNRFDRRTAAAVYIEILSRMERE